LGDFLEPAEYPSLPRWTKMPTDEARKAVNAALMAGIKLASPEAFMVDPDADDAGVRICLGNAPAHRLRDALLALRPILEGKAPRDYATTAPI
jgi:DNA-binding transcriptional MocR family regulator